MTKPNPVGAELAAGEPSFGAGMHTAMDNETAPEIATFQPRFVTTSTDAAWLEDVKARAKRATNDPGVSAADVPALVATVERLARRLAGRYEETENLRAEVERLHQEILALKAGHADLAAMHAEAIDADRMVRECTPAEQDVIEAARAAAAYLKSLNCHPDNQWFTEEARALVTAVDALPSWRKHCAGVGSPPAAVLPSEFERGQRWAVEALRDDERFAGWGVGQLGKKRRSPEVQHLDRPGRLVAADYLESLVTEEAG